MYLVESRDVMSPISGSPKSTHFSYSYWRSSVKPGMYSLRKPRSRWFLVKESTVATKRWWLVGLWNEHMWQVPWCVQASLIYLNYKVSRYKFIRTPISITTGRCWLWGKLAFIARELGSGRICESLESRDQGFIFYAIFWRAKCIYFWG